MANTSEDKYASLKESLDYVFKLISSALIVILLIVGVFLVYYVISNKLVSSKTGQPPKLSLYTIVSGSMEPAIKVSDIILNVRVDDYSTLKVGDVITYQSANSLISDMTITHRIIDIRVDENNKREFITKGDWNQSADSNPIKEIDIIGKTILKIPKLGKIQLLLSTKLGWILIVLIPALGIIIYDILKLFKIVGATTQAESITTVNNDLVMKEENKKIIETLEKIQNNKRAISKENDEKIKDIKNLIKTKQQHQTDEKLTTEDSIIKANTEEKIKEIVKNDKEEEVSVKETISENVKSINEQEVDNKQIEFDNKYTFFDNTDKGKEEAPASSLDELKNLMKLKQENKEIDTKDKP